MGFNETQTAASKALLVALITPKQSAQQTIEYLDELEFLAQTAGIETLHSFTQKADRPDTRTYVGKGKLETIQAAILNFGIDTVIFDDELTPSQLRNLERELTVKIYDRSLLILDIFLQRAQTAQAKTQVELARYQYLLPRLTRMWTHLERQRGGTGTRGGSGEKEIETDKRQIRNQISLLKEKLALIDKQSITRRKGREGIVRVALVGYTNVGKSTLMNLLTKSEVLAENKLFATVDSTVRRIEYENIPFLITDTVGFIRKLPHSLIECFKSTLDEVREADILIHVVDVSNASFHEHIEVVSQTIKELKAHEKPVLLVFNKIDAYEAEEDEFITKTDRLELLQQQYENKLGYQTVLLSALDKTNLPDFRNLLVEMVKSRHVQIYPNML
ncbi:MAG: GTPase HflX [Cytophagales bacterium]|jgi:GTPase